MIEKFFAADDATASIDNTHPGTKLGVAFLHSQADGGHPTKIPVAAFAKSRRDLSIDAPLGVFCFVFCFLRSLRYRESQLGNPLEGVGVLSCLLLGIRYTVYIHIYRSWPTTAEDPVLSTVSPLATCR